MVELGFFAFIAQAVTQAVRKVFPRLDGKIVLAFVAALSSAAVVLVPSLQAAGAELLGTTDPVAGGAFAVFLMTGGASGLHEWQRRRSKVAASVGAFSRWPHPDDPDSPDSPDSRGA